MYEVIWHGRGGQGVVIAAQILAESAYVQGFKGVTSAPTFGPERRGAPLTASTRISDAPIRTFSQIEKADIAVVLDPSLFGVVNILGSLKPEGLLAFSVEHRKGRSWRLTGSVRYAHSPDWLRRRAREEGLAEVSGRFQVLRLEYGARVEGYVSVMRRMV